jgi:hypothetical protein
MSNILKFTGHAFVVFWSFLSKVFDSIHSYSLTLYGQGDKIASKIQNCEMVKA